MFSSRIAGDLAPNRLSEVLRARQAAGRPVIDLTESNPTRVGLDYPKDLLAPLADCRGLTYAPQPFGIMAARQAVADDYQRRGIAIGAERVAVTASTSEAYSLLFKLLASPGDEILVPRPSYPLFEHLTALDGVVARPYDLEYNGVWSIDFNSIDGALGPRTRAVLVVNPNNPTGSFAAQDEIDRLAAVCAGCGVALIADEVFADYELEPGAAGMAAPMLTRDDVLLFALGGLSKSIGLPQVKLGWIATAGPVGLVDAVLRRLELICDTYLSVSTPVQLAAAELLERGAHPRKLPPGHCQLPATEGSGRAGVSRSERRRLVRDCAGAGIPLGRGPGGRLSYRTACWPMAFLRLSPRVVLIRSASAELRLPPASTGAAHLAARRRHERCGPSQPE